MTNVRNFGRNKNYTHGLNVTYTVPLKQIPFLDWMTVKASYNSNYSWSAAALNLDSL
jgi:cell surface protein SprA